jgi:hypothetical protein
MEARLADGFRMKMRGRGARGSMGGLRSWLDVTGLALAVGHH